jgi:hypothetical protein
MNVMASKQALLMILVLGSANAVAATSKCEGTNESAIADLNNAPIEEMQKPSKRKSADCVEIASFISRNKTRPGASNVGKGNNKPGASSSGAYVPKTKDDNTPWRFDMNQNGKRMTAEEFDAWMKAKGINVATGKPKAAAPELECKPSKEVKC